MSHVRVGRRIVRCAVMVAALLGGVGGARAQPGVPAPAPVMTLLGDGLAVRVLTISDDGTELSGDLILDGAVYPFSGRMEADDDGEVVRGTYRAGAETVAFRTEQGDDDEVVTFISGGKRYRLREVAADSVVIPAPRAPAAAPGGGGEAAAPDAGGADAAGGAPGNPLAAKPAVPGTVTMRKVEFRDINMANVVAYTMLVPEGWTEEGHIEWSNAQTPYPQKRISVTGPNKGRIAFFPAMTFSYAEATELAKQESAAMGMPLIIPERQGEAPPRDLGAWLVDFLTRGSPAMKNIRLVKDVRDAETERSMVGQAGGAAGTPPAWEVHLVRLDYELDGAPFTGEYHLTYARNPMVETRNMNMQDWMLFVNSVVSAPAAEFDGLRPVMYASVQSLRAVPQWWTQQQVLIMEITQNNHRIGMEEIRRRGQFYDQMSDDSLAAWKKSVASGDVQQNDRLNAIHEVQDFRDTDGLGVKLPIHYQNYYSDGKGNYLMTNSTMVEPGSEWTRLEPVK